MARITFIVACVILLLVGNGDCFWSSNVDASLESSRPGRPGAKGDIGVTREISGQADNNLIETRIDSVPISRSFFLRPRADIPTNKTTIAYRLGNRVTGDRLVGSSSHNQQWTVPQNVTQILTYPRTGLGATITFVEVIVDQSSNLGRGYVTTGGIGQRDISITIESLITMSYRSNTQIYGY